MYMTFCFNDGMTGTSIGMAAIKHIAEVGLNFRIKAPINDDE